MKVRIKDMAGNERPYEKAMDQGIASLSDAELLSLILRTGTKDRSAVMLAQEVLSFDPVRKGLTSLNYISPQELMKLRGMGKVKCCQMMAVAEISRRMSREASKERLQLSDSGTVAEYFMESARFRTRESLWVIYLDAANSLIRELEISSGSANKALVPIREIFVEALRCDALGIILIHNHPSGDPEPSKEDIVTTANVKRAGLDLGIRLLDHIIIGDRDYVSLLSQGLL